MRFGLEGIDHDSKVRDRTLQILSFYMKRKVMTGWDFDQ